MPIKIVNKWKKVIRKKVTTQSGDTCIFSRLRTNYKIQPTIAHVIKTPNI